MVHWIMVMIMIMIEKLFFHLQQKNTHVHLEMERGTFSVLMLWGRTGQETVCDTLFNLDSPCYSYVK